MEILTDFGIKWELLLAQIVNFTILLFILNKLVYKRVIKLLEERRQKIAQSLKDAKKIEDQLNRVEKERQGVLDKAKEEAKIIINDARSIADEIKFSAETEASKKLESAVKRADEAAQVRMLQMEKQIKKDVVDLIVDTLKITTGKVLTKNDQDNLIAKNIEQIKRDHESQ